MEIGSGLRILPLLVFVFAVATSVVAAAQPAARPIFVEVDAGVDFVHENGASGSFYLPEIVGGGGALLDYDGDGDLDLYLVQSGRLAGGEAAGALGDRLFRNELVPGGAVRFADATSSSGVVATGYGMGVASGDYDNDGRPDLYVTRYGSNSLLRNGADGAFRDVTRAAGVDDPRWSVAATFFDYDRDGWLDLFVGNYVDFSVAGKRECFAASSSLDYCGPDAYQALPDRFWRNRGDGTFEELTHESGLATAFGAALGAVAADFDADGWMDLYVANDGDPNQLWINRSGSGFRDEAGLAGVALNREGMAEAGMGVDAGDFDGDGDEDLFLTHLSEETNTLYVNGGGLLFVDRTIEARLHAPSLRFTGFGTAFLDYDNDGRLDLIALNGAVRIVEELARAGDPYPLGQPNQLFRNGGDGRFVDVSQEAGEAFHLLEVSRGAVLGDLDNDGDADVVQVNNRGPARLLLNQVGQDRHWLGLGLRRAAGDTTALGSSVEVDTGELRLVRRAGTDGGFASAHDPRLLFGLGDRAEPVTVRVHWLGGGIETWPDVAVDRYHTLVEGSAGAPP